MHASFLTLSALAVLIAAGYYVIVTSRRFVLHQIALVSFVILGIGLQFKLLHWTGADEIIIISYFGLGLGAFLLIWTGLRNPTKTILLYQLIAGILVVFMVINHVYPVYALNELMRLLPYPIAGVTGTILLRELYVHQGEKNVVNMFLIVSIISVIGDLRRFF